MEKLYFALVFLAAIVLPHLGLHRGVQIFLVVVLGMVLFWMGLVFIDPGATARHMTDGGMVFKVLGGVAFNIIMWVLYAQSKQFAKNRK